jgi:hypothetical protein
MGTAKRKARGEAAYEFVHSKHGRLRKFPELMIEGMRQIFPERQSRRGAEDSFYLIAGLAGLHRPRGKRGIQKRAEFAWLIPPRIRTARNRKVTLLVELDRLYAKCGLDAFDTPEEVRHFLGATYQDEETGESKPAIRPGWYVPIKLAIFSGLRQGEQFALRIGVKEAPPAATILQRERPGAPPKTAEHELKPTANVPA